MNLDPKTAYPRTTDPEMMRLHARPETKSFYDYWDGKRKGRSMPSREDIDPLEMKAWLSGIQLIDVQQNPRRFVYRLVGEVEVRMRGYNHAGRSVEDAFFGVSRDDVLGNYSLVAENRTMVFDWARYRSHQGFEVVQETIFLPLSADDANVNKIITFTVVQNDQ